MTAGIKNWKAFLNQDISVNWSLSGKKLALAKQVKLLQLMTNLFKSGFHLAEIIEFLDKSKLTDQKFVKTMREGLLEGKNLSEIMGDLGFNQSVVTQISLAQAHGNLQETMELVEKNLMKIQQLKKKLLQLMTYPVVLLLFLAGIMLGLKNYLLPQLESQNAASGLINHFPQLFLGGLLLIIGLSLLVIHLAKKRPALEVCRRLAKIPGLKKSARLYFTAYFAREWGNLICQGLEFREILPIMQEQKNRLFKEIGLKLEEKMNKGESFSSQIDQLKIFNPELALIIEYGELKSKLGRELLIYSDECSEKFFFQINQKMQFIQPIVFIFVALMIVLVYAAMLLPIYQNMNQLM